MIRFEQEARAAGFHRIAGVDEAGRGPLAGPVVAAAVIIDPLFLEKEADGVLSALTDSKQLSLRQRETFYDLLTSATDVEIGIGMADVEEIDTINILRATYEAMGRALAALDPLPDHVLVDGNPVPNLPCPSHAIVKGDSLSLSIAAASVIAKVTRDRLLIDLDVKYPGYGFAAHKGYGTREHLAALKKLGPCPAHRRSFKPVSLYDQPDLFP